MPSSNSTPPKPKDTSMVVEGHVEEPLSEEKRQDLFRQAFQSTLGAFASAEDDTHALLGRLVAFGRINREEGARMFQEVRALMEQRRNEVETNIQTAITTAMKRLTIPTPEDVAEVAQKLAELERRVEALADMEPPQEKPRTPVARRTALQAAPDAAEAPPAPKPSKKAR